MNCTSDWSIPFSGTKRWVLFDPDMNATYWYYAVTRKENDTTGFRFHGKFAHARYQANNAPDSGSNNPFLLAVPRDTRDRHYTVWVVPEGADTEGFTNVITFPTSV